jgi:putative membrane protein
MKNFGKICLLISTMFIGFSCNREKATTGETDSVEAAEERNEAKEDTAMAGDAADTHEEASEFLVKAASGGLMEVELGKMAQKNGANADVKTFGKRMETDHTKANQELKTLAASKNVTIPSTPGEDEQKHINDMQKMTGAAFDRHYMDMMVTDHKKDIELFEDATEDNEIDPDVKAFAQKTLPILRQHLELAQKTNDKVKK